MRDNQTGEVVGTYRIITPDVAQNRLVQRNKNSTSPTYSQSDEASTLMEVGRAWTQRLSQRLGGLALVENTLNFAKENATPLSWAVH